MYLVVPCKREYRMPKTKLYWDDQDDVPEEISLVAVWGICLVFSLILTGIIYVMNLSSYHWGYIEKFNPLLFFISFFIISGLIGTLIRWDSMNERRHKKG